ncbi:MAG: acetoacetate--CoA ligase [Ferrovibrio sp.]|uniref:acetoacetate--CoA ligase n=1 Tax=Ferrovibrio sp. TaxID=1917215 RepID=UPI002613DE9A|nr:acetoacetate--CoA ligase [Ferrovibrio sp.]MCW0236579.1 acetoacetate--CoA ligase [Ferrovibrio sp.]
MTETAAPALLWTPSAERIRRSQLRRYMDWLARERGLVFADYDALWQWSVTDVEAFWASLWDYFQIRAHKPYSRVLGRRTMPGAEWFTGAELNFAEEVFRHETDQKPAILYSSETQPLKEMSWHDLRGQAGAMAAHLRRIGVKRGDRVVAYAPNTPETIIAFLAVISIGAVWSVCSPDMGLNAVLDRFRQIEPVAIFAVPSSHYNGKFIDKGDVLAALVAELPTVKNLVLMPGETTHALPGRVALARWAEIVAAPVDLQIESVPFDHPLWVVYSSGTTGLPKPIVHGHGGIVVVIMAMMALHNDIAADDIFHWYSSTGWIMWNAQVSGLLVGATIAIYDGSPSWPDWNRLWQFVGEVKATFFGAGAAFYANCQKAGVEPRKVADLSGLRTVGSTGSPLSEDSYAWIYDQLGKDIWLTPISGGTDFAGAFVAGCVLKPVYAGEMQVRCLGADIQAFDDNGRPLQDEVGELVCVAPIPSMPLFLWNDPDGKRYHDSYFDMYPGIWRHGDWIRITPRGGAIIYGRSDATINRYGLRLGTSEIYRAVEELPEMLDSLVVDLEYLGRDSYMPLFVVLRPGLTLDAALKDRINQAIRKAVSARFVPNDIFQVSEVPRTLSGKKLEVPVKKILLGQAADKVSNPGTMANPGSLAWFVEFAKQRAA